MLDLGGVGRADSAGLALLVEWSRQARRGRTALRFVNVPAQIRSLARVSHLEWLLAREWQPNTADRAEEPA
jgi:phospholipid transport system transporter-binding protein